MTSIVLIAPPAAGKGTQAKKISIHYNIPHISTGDLLRNEEMSRTPLGLQISEIMQRGDLVDDEIITKLIEQRINYDDCKEGYILDGYPRTIQQAIAYDIMLEKLNKKSSRVLFLDIAEETALSRISSRLVCSNCGSSYNTKVEELTPKNNNMCDKCQGVLHVRADDNEETFRKRFATYKKETSKLIDYYKNKNMLYEIKINETDNVEDTFNKIKKALDNNG
ncbi:MAG: adenylate kinase [bacterium]|nr:adenylate kinase [bacterium]